MYTMGQCYQTGNFECKGNHLWGIYMRRSKSYLTPDMFAQGKSVQWHLRYFQSVCRRCKEWDISRRRLEYKEMKRTDQDQIGTWLLPHRPRLLGQSQFKPCLWPGYFLLQSADCMLETCMLLAGERIHEHWWPQKKPLVGWRFKPNYFF